MNILSDIVGGLACELSFIAEDIGFLVKDVVEVAKDNPVASTAVLTVATGGVGFVAAPFVATTLGGAGLLGAASTGTAISTLSGAASTSASLAAIGGGSIASGGFGMAGGTAVITGASALGGTAAGASVTKKSESD